MPRFPKIFVRIAQLCETVTVDHKNNCGIMYSKREMNNIFQELIRCFYRSLSLFFYFFSHVTCHLRLFTYIFSRFYQDRSLMSNIFTVLHKLHGKNSLFHTYFIQSQFLVYTAGDANNKIYQNAS